MVKHDLKGIAKVTAKRRTYWYAWRGGPRLRGDPGSPEFHASYVEAHEALRTPDSGRFHFLVVSYRANVLPLRSPSTRRVWGRWLDLIDEHFGELRIAQFERSLKIKPLIIRWRGQWADKPRTADYAVEVLSAVLSHAVDVLGKLSGNPCEGIKQLYSVDRSDIVWTPANIATLKRSCSAEVAHAVDLASHTGLRLGDLIRLSWCHIGDDAIRIATSKSGGKRKATVPLYDALRGVLAGIPKRSTTILTNSLGRPWTAKGLSNAFSLAKNAAGFTDLHFHDLRGTVATFFYKAGLGARDIASVLGWSEEHVDKIIRRYVSQDAAIQAAIVKLNRAGT